jgi:hypothetical protein
LVYFVVIWYIFPRFGIFYQEKSGNPEFKYGFNLRVEVKNWPHSILRFLK